MRSLRLLAVFLALGAGLAFAPAVDGVSNFQRVDSRVYRGAQPAPHAFGNLARLGIRTVLDLRDSRGQSAAEEKLVHAAGMRFVSIPMKGLGAPTGEQVAQALAVLADDSAVPVFVHCRRGADRTGTVIACYRIAFQDWSNRQALDEAKSRGLSFMERGMRRFILGFQTPAATPSLVPATAH
jgi:tyrosine-protein phosphatase SIW14